MFGARVLFWSWFATAPGHSATVAERAVKTTTSKQTTTTPYVAATTLLQQGQVKSETQFSLSLRVANLQHFVVLRVLFSWRL